MTWKRSAALLALLALSGCALPSGTAHTAPSIPRCATLEARALVSPNAPLTGALACLTPALQQASGFTSDADIQAVAAQPPVYTSYRYAGHTVAGYYFEFSAGGGPLGCFRFHVDSSGLVDKAAFKTNGCPRPLP